jgi:hypothetical protein
MYRHVEDIFRRLRELEDRVLALEQDIADYREWSKRRGEILRRAKRQRGRNVIVLFPKAAIGDRR